MRYAPSQSRLRSMRAPRSLPARQRGAALFIALMILIIMTLLALSASQVTSLQERMSNIYRADNLAFQEAEERLRDEERAAIDNPLSCDAPPKASVSAGWLDGTSATQGIDIENLNNARSPYARGIDLRGSARSGLATGPGSPTCMVFRLSSYAFDTDNAANRTSRAIVQSTYTP
jgi:type IV pilus assembly protein PilX